ncbi:TPA: helix-turn-helix transcriptional regulator, partial [Clostridioides difficile]|nr:helix-turn-helix transcriptional regulator [Clostridioides difficile]HBZ5561753.1 helix-turn-helix transcriptional regulator [Clostridioides difficile]
LKIGASSTTIAKLSSNKNVSLDVIDKICKALDCQPGDIMEYEDDEKL